MAQTISFSAGAFTLENVPGPGSEHLFVVKDGSTGRFSLTNKERFSPTVVNLGLLGDSSPTLPDLIDFPAPTKGNTVIGLTANLQAGDDQLTISGPAHCSFVNMGDGNDSFVSDTFSQSQAVGGLGNDTFNFRVQFSGSSLDAGAGNDSATFCAVQPFLGHNSSIDMGAGDDVLVFGGVVSGSSINSRATINLGTGSDQVSFRSNVTKTNLDLGGDNVQDTVRLVRGRLFWQGFQITGADTSDRLIIGTSRPNPSADVTSQYVSGNTWQNVNNPNDQINF